MNKRGLGYLVGLIWLFITVCLFATTPTIEAEGAILIEAKTNTILYEKNAYTQFYPASTTKILTAMLIEESLNEGQIISKTQDSVQSVPSDSSHIGLSIGDQYTVKEGLYGLMVGSDNFIAHDLAKASRGSIQAFADWMNEAARACGALNTHFTNPHGYHDPNHYTTPYDLAQIARKAFENPDIVKLAGTSQYTFHIASTQRTIEIFNKNRLFRKDTPYYNAHVVAAKTGFHDDAKQTLVAKAIYGEMELIAVVMKADTPNQYEDINKLFRYGEENFQVKMEEGSVKLINLSSSSWAKDLVNMAIERNWVVERGQNYQRAIPVADFIYMLNTALELKNKITLDQIRQIVGKPTIEKEYTLTRLETAMIIRELADKEGWTKPIISVNPYIPDIANLDIKHRQTIEYMVKRQLLGNKEIPFRPNEKLTWQEAIAMAVRIL